MKHQTNVIVTDNQPVHIIDCDHQVRIDGDPAHIVEVANHLLNRIQTEQPQLQCESGKIYLIKMLVVVTEVK